MAASMFKTFSANFQHESATVEQEQDANSALTELDKGLRSVKNGVQCESVVRFPRLFEKYPFPILINSAFLRLADVFRAGNNFIRLCILQVTQQSQKHLDKILSVDEIVRRLFTVIHSNDPVARSITLRTLGSIANIIPEKKNVHHSIVTSLDSRDAIEVEAAIYAAERFSAKSRIFAANICGKIAQMIEGLATPVDLKLKLIPVLQHMHHDAETAAKARNVCLELLSAYPAEQFVTLTLHTMSQLAVHSLVDIQIQVELLIHQLENSERNNIKAIILQELHMLAKKSPHLWKYYYVEVLCRFVLTTKFRSLKIGCLHVLTTLSKSVAFQLFMTRQEANMELLLEVSNLSYQSDHVTLTSKAVEFYTYIAICYSKINGDVMWSGRDLVEEAQLAVSTQVILSASADMGSVEQRALKLCLHCAVELSQNHQTSDSFFVADIVNLLETASDQTALMFCECLAAIGSENSLVIHPIIPQLLNSLRNHINSGQQISQLQLSILLVYVFTLLFQAAMGEIIPPDVHDVLISCTKTADPWVNYKIARQAMRYGQYHIAGCILQSLTKKIASEHYYFWLLGLQHINDGERCLQEQTPRLSEFQMQISRAVEHYQRGLVTLKAATTPSFPLQFQEQYISLRAEVLQVHSQLIQTCNTFRTCPPPAIAAALSMTNGQEISRCGQIVQQLMKCAKSYELVSKKIVHLYQTAFDADPHSLNNVQLLQESCEVMRLSAMSVVNAQTTGMSDKLVTSMHAMEADRFPKAIQEISEGMDKLFRELDGVTITHKHMEFLCDSARRLVGVSLPFPRYFFQSLQSTSVKLAVSPQQGSGREPVSVQHDTHLTLKVEGVVQHGKNQGLFRTVHSLCINVNSQIQSRSASAAETKTTESLANSLTNTVQPHNDYFSSSFLLAFPVVGFHSVTIEASIIDEGGSLWKTGPRVTLNVKSYDDVMQRQQASKLQMRQSFGQVS
ncbi:hypothetical protein ScPMuIL_014647 [Solemya velum]